MRSRFFSIINKFIVYKQSIYWDVCIYAKKTQLPGKQNPLQWYIIGFFLLSAFFPLRRLKEMRLKPPYILELLGHFLCGERSQEFGEEKKHK